VTKDRLNSLTLWRDSRADFLTSKTILLVRNFAVILLIKTVFTGKKILDYITGGTEIPITDSTRISSRRTTAAVASRNLFRSSSASVRM
jgi:hypothetical protein